MKVLPLALSALSGTAKSKINDATVTAKIYTIIGICTAVSLVFLLIAITALLAAEIGLIYACFVMGAVFALVALGGLLRLRAHNRKQVKVTVKQPVVAASPDPSSMTADIAMSAAAAFARGFMNPKP